MGMGENVKWGKWEWGEMRMGEKWEWGKMGMGGNGNGGN